MSLKFKTVQHLDDGSIGIIVAIDNRAAFPLFVVFEDGTTDWHRWEHIKIVQDRRIKFTPHGIGTRDSQ